jgi:hypothetical protein
VISQHSNHAIWAVGKRFTQPFFFFCAFRSVESFNWDCKPDAILGGFQCRFSIVKAFETFNMVLSVLWEVKNDVTSEEEEDWEETEDEEFD